MFYHYFYSFFTLFSLVSLIVAKQYSIELHVSSKNKQIDGYGLQLYNERNNVYWFFLSQHQPQKLIYDDSTRYIYYDAYRQTRIYFKLQGNTLLMSPNNPYNVYIDYKTYRLSFNYDNNLYAVKNINDPKGISKYYYAIKHYQNPNNVPHGAVKINYLYARFI